MKESAWVEYYQDKNDLWRIRVVATNWKILARSTKGFEKLASLSKFVRAVNVKTSSHGHYRDKKKEWRWRLVDNETQFKVVASQGYSRKEDCVHGFELTFNCAISIEQYGAAAPQTKRPGRARTRRRSRT